VVETGGYSATESMGWPLSSPRVALKNPKGGGARIRNARFLTSITESTKEGKEMVAR
jgi:hypothetical protein